MNQQQRCETFDNDMDLPSPKNHTTWDRSPFFRALRFTRPRADPADLDLNVSFHDQQTL